MKAVSLPVKGQKKPRDERELPINQDSRVTKKVELTSKNGKIREYDRKSTLYRWKGCAKVPESQDLEQEQTDDREKLLHFDCSEQDQSGSFG
jgi:hypothetical protein